MMKRLILVMMLAVLCLGANAQTKQGYSSVGVTTGYAFDQDNVTFGVDYRICLFDNVRFAPSLTYLVKNDGLSAWNIDMNAHYIFKLSNQFGFYPLGGLDIAFWKYSIGDGKWSYNDNQTRLGLNVGMGGEVYALQDLTVGLELKYLVTEDHSQPMFGVRIGYNF
jgi:opacity protein-like surface antigen